jgi:tetratricopeptide (TPR) repeat protein
LLSEAGWTGQQLAREVNALGAECGLTLRYDRTSVAHWLSGSRPNPPVPELITEVFIRKLGHRPPANCPGETRSPQEGHVCGPAVMEAGPGLAGDELDTAAKLTELNAGRGRLQRGGVYSVALLAVPGWTQATRASPPLRASSPDRIDREEAEAAHAMGRVFSEADSTFGGGRSVTALAAYLAYDIAPKLRSRASPAVRQEMLTAATQLTYLCAFMFFDQEQHAAAQRYYTVALQLAAENHDPVGYATILRAMSVQAHSLGHARHALDLADGAVSTAPGNAPPGTWAFMYGQAAVAAASAGDKHAALAHLKKAESCLARGAIADEPVGNYHQASLAHQRSAVLSALGDIPGAVIALATSIQHRPAAERRSRAITLAALAQLQLRQGHLEQAAMTWRQFLGDYPHLRSGRVTSALATLRETLRPYQRNTAVAATLARAAGM